MIFLPSLKPVDAAISSASWNSVLFIKRGVTQKLLYLFCNWKLLKLATVSTVFVMPALGCYALLNLRDIVVDSSLF